LKGCRPLSSSGEPIPLVVVATHNGRAYYLACRLLRELGIRYHSALPGRLPPHTGVVLTTAEESALVRADRVLVLDELLADKYRGRQLLAESLMQEGDHELIVGLDPGKRIGLVAFYGSIPVEARVFEEMREAVGVVLKLVKQSPAKVRRVRVGNGDQEGARRLIAALLRKLDGAAILELVDERGSNYIRCPGFVGLRRDARAAAAIAFRSGVVLAGL
jgi:hypothetical protein